jgi:serine-aspartate repeat-containing protein C/D/E
MKQVYPFLKKSYLVFLLLFTAFNMYAQNNCGLNVNFSVGSPAAASATVQSGNTFFYTAQVSTINTPDSTRGGTVTIPIPAFVEVDNVVGPQIQSVSPALPATGPFILVIKLTNPLPLGYSADLIVNCNFPGGITPNGSGGATQATFSSTNCNSGPVVSAPVTVTSAAVDPWTITKTVVSGGAVGGNITYSVNVMLPNWDTRKNSMDLLNSVITDNLPAGSVFVSATGGGVYNAGTHEVVWNAGYLDAPANNNSYPNPVVSYQVTVNFPAGSFPVATTITNNAALTGNLAITTGLPAIHLASVSTVIANPVPAGGCVGTGVSVSGTSNNVSYLVDGGTGRVQLNFGNSGNVPLTNFLVEMPIPPQVDITKIYSGSYSVNGVPGFIYYETNLNATSRAVNGSSPTFTTSSGGSSYNVSGLGLLPGEYITKLIWSFPSVPIGFSTHNGSTFADFNILTTDRNGNPVNPAPTGTTDNCSNPTYTGINFQQFITADYNGSQVVNGNCQKCRLVFVTPVPPPPPPPPLTTSIGNVKKSVKTAGPYLPGQIIRYELDFTIGGSVKALDVYVQDALPVELTYTGNISYSFPSGQPLPVFSQSGQNLLWDWSTNISPDNQIGNGTYKISFDVMIKNGTQPGNINNCMVMGAGNVTGGPYNSCRSINISAVAQLSTYKGSKGDLNTDYVYYPNIGSSLVAGNVSYKLVLKNNGNVPMKNITLIDILPYVGDKSVVSSTLRNSDWSPSLQGPVIAPAGVNVFYSVNNNISIPEFVPAYNPGGCVAANWSSSLPAVIGNVKSLKFVIPGILNPSDSLVIKWTMSIPLSIATGTIAYNSFAYQAQRTDNNAFMLVAEPAKVGVQIDEIVLPVTLINFSGRLANEVSELKWKIAEENNFEYYNVMRSTDGIHFENIGSVPGRKNGLSVNEYFFNDNVSAMKGTKLFYRIQIVSENNKTKQSNILILNRVGQKINGFSLAPNPATTYSSVRISSTKSSLGLVKITDITGRTLFYRNEFINKGENVIQINDLDKYDAGIYIISLTVDGETYSSRLILTK